MFPSRWHQEGAVLFGVAGGMLVVASGLVAAYFALGALGSRAEAASTPAKATREPARPAAAVASGAEPPAELAEYLNRHVELVTPHGSVRPTWGELGAVVDDAELAQV